MESINLLDDEQSAKGNAGITGQMMADLDKTAGWLRYLGMMSMIVCGLLTLFTFIGLFVMSGISESGIYPGGEAIFFVFIFLVVVAGGCFLSLLVYRYGNNLRRYTKLRQMNYLEEALEHNKNIWIICGIILIIALFLIFMSMLFIGRTTSL